MRLLEDKRTQRRMWQCKVKKWDFFCVPSYGFVCCEPLSNFFFFFFFFFWLTTVELSEFFLLGAVASMWLWHWTRGCRVTSPLPGCHAAECQMSDAPDIFVCCCWLLLYSAFLRSRIDIALTCDSTWVTSFLKCIFLISNEVMYLSADMAGATWNCCRLGAFCVHHTTMHSCYSLDLFNVYLSLEKYSILGSQSPPVALAEEALVGTENPGGEWGDGELYLMLCWDH